MSQDPELQAISGIIGLLSGLDEESRHRVIDYVLRRFGNPITHRHVTAPKPQEIPDSSEAPNSEPKRTRSKKRGRTRPAQPSEQPESKADIPRLVNAFKNLDNYAQLDNEVVGKPDLLNRILLALSIYRTVYGDVDGMTSGEVQRFYRQLNVNIGLPNISMGLTNRAKQFVMTEGMRARGTILRYRLSRHGVQQAKSLGFPAAD